MKNIIPFIFLYLFITQFVDAQESSYTDEIKDFQLELNTQYGSEKSPLTKDDLKTFEALDFFEINEKYYVEAEFELTPNAPIFEMQTTTDRAPLYRRYGIARFTLNGVKCELSLYQNQNFMASLEYGNHLFLPYNDLTNGDTSYGGGRYVEGRIPEGDTIIIDFNKTYNPYCAYNAKYSCPIVPRDNYVDAEIKAGVKAFDKH